MVARKEFSKKTCREAFERAGGYCERCGMPFGGKPVEYHHRIEAYLGGDNSLENVACVCVVCHRELTAERHPEIDKVRRLSDRNIGIKKRKSRLSHPTLRRKMDGSVVPR